MKAAPNLTTNAFVFIAFGIGCTFYGLNILAGLGYPI